MNVPTRIQQDVEILTCRRGNEGDRAVRLKELRDLDQRTAALAGSVQRQIVDAGIPTIRDTVTSIRGFIYNTLTYVDNEVQGARDELRDLIDAQGVTLANVQSVADGNSAALTLEAAARATEDTALAGQILTISAQVDENSSNLTIEQLARTNADTALAADISTLQANFGAANASLTQQGQVLATLEGYAAATYVIRAAAGGAAAGLEIVAADDPISGAASALRFYGDDILFDGSIAAHHIDATSLFINAGNVVGPLPQSQISGLTNSLNSISGTANTALNNAVIAQNSATSAASAASNASAVANGKNTIYRTTSTPVGVRVGDIWYNPSTSIWRFWSGFSWTQASIIADSVVTNWLGAQTIIANQITGTLNTDRINFDGSVLEKNAQGKLSLTEGGVTTPLIADNAATTLTYASVTSSLDNYAFNTWREFLVPSPWINSQGKPVTISFMVEGDVPSQTDQTHQLEIRRGTTVVYRETFDRSVPSDRQFFVAGAFTWANPFTTGTKWSLWLRTTGSGGFQNVNGSLAVQVLKK